MEPQMQMNWAAEGEAVLPPAQPLSWGPDPSSTCFILQLQLLSCPVICSPHQAVTLYRCQGCCDILLFAEKYADIRIHCLHWSWMVHPLHILVWGLERALWRVFWWGSLLVLLEKLRRVVRYKGMAFCEGTRGSDPAQYVAMGNVFNWSPGLYVKDQGTGMAFNAVQQRQA